MATSHQMQIDEKTFEHRKNVQKSRHPLLFGNTNSARPTQWGRIEVYFLNTSTDIISNNLS